MKDKILCKSRISKNYQTTVQKAARAILELEPGDEIWWILKDGQVTVEKSKGKKACK